MKGDMRGDMKGDTKEDMMVGGLKTDLRVEMKDEIVTVLKERVDMRGVRVEMIADLMINLKGGKVVMRVVATRAADMTVVPAMKVVVMRGAAMRKAAMRAVVMRGAALKVVGMKGRRVEAIEIQGSKILVRESHQGMREERVAKESQNMRVVVRTSHQGMMEERVVKENHRGMMEERVAKVEIHQRDMRVVRENQNMREKGRGGGVMRESRDLRGGINLMRTRTFGWLIIPIGLMI
mmetsp:Transcript_39067/g.54485  ORF Transcript_39067/g.54485 Transcript_39067/m.54485 type:complete len:236 (+) Transcript_39067:1004-1711(+)